MGISVCVCVCVFVCVCGCVGVCVQLLLYELVSLILAYHINLIYMCYTSGLPRDTMSGIQLKKNEKGRLVIKCKIGGISYKLSIQVKNE